MLPDHVDAQQPQNEEVFPLERLEDGQLYYLLKFLDNHSLTAIAQVNKKYRTLANQILDQRLENRITALYEQLPVETKALLPLAPIIQDVPRFMALVPFMQAQFSLKPNQRNLTPAKLNQVAVGCYWINHQVKYPMAPLPELPTFDEARLTRDPIKESTLPLYSQIHIMLTMAINLLTFLDMWTLFSPGYPSNRYTTHVIASVLLVLGVIPSSYLTAMILILWYNPTPLQEDYRKKELTAHPSYKAWLDLIVQEVTHGKGNMLDMQTVKLRKNYLLLNIFSILFALPTWLYLCCVPMGSLCMPLAPFIPAIFHHETDKSDPSSTTRKIKIGRLTAVMFTIYALTFHFFYLNQDMKDRIARVVYTDHEYMRICFASHMAATAVLAAIGLFHAARYTVHTSHTWCPSRRPVQALIPNDDMELTNVSVPRAAM